MLGRHRFAPKNGKGVKKLFSNPVLYKPSKIVLTPRLRAKHLPKARTLHFNLNYKSKV